MLFGKYVHYQFLAFKLLEADEVIYHFYCYGPNMLCHINYMGTYLGIGSKSAAKML